MDPVLHRASLPVSAHGPGAARSQTRPRGGGRVPVGGSMGRCASTPSSPVSRTRPTTPAGSRRSAWTAPITFEGPHDVFTPLVLAATASSSLELATNVAIAFPRNPIQLAHQAWDLQLLSQGSVHPRTRQSDTGPGGEALRGRIRPADRPDARAGGGAPGDLRLVGDRRAARFPGRVHLAHPDAPDVQPGAPSLRPAADRPRRPRPPDGVPGRGGGRRAPGHAVQHRPALPRPHPPGDGGGSGPGRSHPGLAHRHR